MESDFKVYPAGLGEKDYWGQVKRTVNGTPVSEEQIQLIREAIVANLGLKMGGEDALLDLGCGNGALSDLLFDSVSTFLGIDYSEYLITVAKRDFERSPNYRFEVADVLDYVISESTPDRFNKVLCYGCFSYFPVAEELLTRLHERFTNVSHVFLGNLPDKARMAQFYKTGLPEEAELCSHDSKIGIWRTAEELTALAEKAGWKAKIQCMPAAFYASHYRYDVTLERMS
jgi:cyclopropane fatty-acyl-phospholipid synthase-like methyltransferase